MATTKKKTSTPSSDTTPDTAASDTATPDTATTIDETNSTADNATDNTIDRTDNMTSDTIDSTAADSTENTTETATDQDSAASEKTTPASSLTDAEREAIASMPYEEARDKLIHAVQVLEAGGLNLDQSMHQWELGEALAQRAQSLLNDVRARLDAAQAEQATSAQTAGTQSNLD